MRNTLGTLAVLYCATILAAGTARATSNHDYGPNEYDTVANGISPDGLYAITAHGEGDLGYDHFHIYLTSATTGKKFGPLEEIVGTLDTGADAFAAKWSKDSKQVVIVYRVDRQKPLKAMFYQIQAGRAKPIKGPVDLDNDDPLCLIWQQESSDARPSPKIFGSPIKQ